MTRIKTVVSLEHQGVMYFRMNSCVRYWTNELENAKMYSGKAKAKVCELENYINDGIREAINRGDPNQLARIFIYANGSFSGFDDKDAIFLEHQHLRTIRLYEVGFTLKPIKQK